MAGSDKQQVQVWDLPVRVMHWSLVACFATAVATGFIGGNAMEWHLYAGEAILALALTRVLWGFSGGETARFRSFIRGPGEVFRYCRDVVTGASRVDVGHNPLGGWMVLVMLTSLVVQAITGLFANDDIATEGPLYHLVSKETSDFVTSIHKLNGYALMALAAIHLLAILGYLLVKKENLVRPMISGVKQLPAAVVSRPYRLGSAGTAFKLFLVIAAALAAAMKLL